MENKNITQMITLLSEHLNNVQQKLDEWDTKRSKLWKLKTDGHISEKAHNYLSYNGDFPTEKGQINNE